MTDSMKLPTGTWSIGESDLGPVNRPAMSEAAIRFRRELLAPLLVSHRVNFENDTFTIEAPDDFIRVAWEHARRAGIRMLPIFVTDQELGFTVSGTQPFYVKIIGAGAPGLISLTPSAFPSDTQKSQRFFDTSAKINLDAVKVVAQRTWRPR